MTRHRVLDGLLLASGAAYVGFGLLIAFVFWPGVANSLVAGPGEFATAFARLSGTGRGVLTALGTLTAVLVLVTLVREGGVSARRGRLRLFALVAFVTMGLVSALALDPAGDAITSAAREGTA